MLMTQLNSWCLMVILLFLSQTCFAVWSRRDGRFNWKVQSKVCIRGTSGSISITQLIKALFSVSDLTGTALPMVIMIVLAHAHGLRQYTIKKEKLWSHVSV